MNIPASSPRSIVPRNAPPLLLPILGIVIAIGFLAGLAYFVSIYVAAVLFVPGFLALVYLRPDLAFGFILASAPFSYDLGLGPVNVAISDISMVIAVPVLLMNAKDPFGRFLRNPMIPAVAAYFLVCAISILANGNLQDAISSMIQMSVYMIVALFVFSSCINDRRLLFSGMYGLLISCSLLAVMKLCSNSLYILGLHKNSIGASLSYGVLVAVELWISSRGRQKRLLFIALVVIMAGLVTTLSRGAWMGALGGVMVILLLRKQFVFGARLAALAVPILVVCWMILPEQAKETATDISAGRYSSLGARLNSINYAYSIFSRNPLLGGGVGIRKQYDATNLVMSTLAETGIAGIITFMSIFLVFGWMVWRARNRMFVSSPLLPLLTIGSALVLCIFLHGLVDHFWSRGCLPAWAGMGAAAYVYQATQQQRKAIAVRG